MNVGHLRLISFLEGLSFLLLLGVAMPLKYMFDQPFLVPYAGMTHGVLFLLFIVILVVVCHRQGWGIGMLLLGLLASVLPFAPFVFERYIKNKADEDDLRA